MSEQVRDKDLDVTSLLIYTIYRESLRETCQLLKDKNINVNHVYQVAASRRAFTLNIHLHVPYIYM